MLLSPNKSVKTILFLAIFFSNDVLTEYVCTLQAQWCPDNNYCDVAINRCMPCSHVCDIFKDDQACDKHCDGYKTTTTTPRIPKKNTKSAPQLKETQTKTASGLCEGSSSCKPSIWNTVLEVTLGLALVTVVVLLLCFMRLYHRARVRLHRLPVRGPDHGHVEMIELDDIDSHRAAGDGDNVEGDMQEGGDHEAGETSPLRTVSGNIASHAIQTVEEELVEQPGAVEVEIHQVSGVS